MDKQNMGLWVVALAAVAVLVVCMMPRTIAPEIQAANLMLGLVLRFVVGATALCVPAAGVIAVSAFYRYTHKLVPADARALYPVMEVNGQWILPQANPAQIAAAWSAGHAQVQLTATEPQRPAVAESRVSEAAWPQMVNLEQMLTEPVSLAHLALGVTLDDTGAHNVYGDMNDLVHVAVGGSSGFGKSVFLRALTYQLAVARERPDLVLIDLEGVTLAPFGKCDRLLYPLADNERDAAAVLTALSEDELNRRKELFARYPGVDSLARYNAVADEQLRPIVTVIDEGTALLGDRSVETALKTLTLRSRKYGLWVVCAGQDWKATSLDSAIKNQLSTTVQFRARSAAQSRVLLGVSGAENLPTDPKGRALAQLPGRGLVELQTPYIGRTQLLAGIARGTPRMGMPKTEAQFIEDSENMKTDERIQLLHQQGLSSRKIQMRVFGYVGGSAFDTVSRVISVSS